MIDYKRDGQTMIQVAPFQFVTEAYLSNSPVIRDESEAAMHPNQIELHRIAKLIREAIEAGEEV